MYLNVGRGHPFYLDGIIDALNRSGQVGLLRGIDDVFEVATGLSRLGWKAVRSLYRAGSSPGTIGKLYERLRQRTDYNKTGVIQSLLGRNLRHTYDSGDMPLVVSHPMLVGALRGRANLIYQHGELVVPGEALVTGAEYVIVPTESAAEAFRHIGYPADNIFISGLCIEPSLVRQARDAYHMRLERYLGTQPLAGAFFSSGAEPPEHLQRLVAAALAAAFLEQRVVIFARKNGELAQLAAVSFLKQNVTLLHLDSSRQMPTDLPPALLVEYANRREETYFTSKLFPWLDYFVAPSHERTNWAFGLGLPMFILDPPFGSYAPLNRQLALARTVAVPIVSQQYAYSFGTHLQSLRHRGALTSMARAGWGTHDINGFQSIAGFLVKVAGA